MKATISRDSLWLTIQSLSLSNQKWLAGKLQQNIREQEEASEEYISKEEVLAGIDAGLKELKLMREGKLKSVPFDELIKELEDESQD